MGISVIPAPAGGGKTRKVETLTSGSSWTVPAGVEYVVATLQGGGGGGGTGENLGSPNEGQNGKPGQRVISTVTTTPGASISYTIGAGGIASSGSGGGTGGTTTFTGATSATGGLGGGSSDAAGVAGTAVAGFDNGGNAGHSSGGSNRNGAAGGAGFINLEYWV